MRTGVAFSSSDITSAINADERLSLVQSGNEVFALLRTERTPGRVSRAQIHDVYAAYFREYCLEGMSVQSAVRYTVVDLCQSLVLAFYVGIVFESLEEVYLP